MELIRGQHPLHARYRGCVATIGSFDGVHLGHQALLATLTEAARQHRLPRLVITFEPQPREFFAAEAPPPRLMRLREKLSALRGLGLERVLCLKFNAALARQPAETFIHTLLVQQLGIRHLVIGEHFRFGQGRAGDVALLTAIGLQAGFTVSQAPTLMLDDARISSTRIRTALARGALTDAARYLGRPYDMQGHVAYGEQLGRTLGFPTANVHLHRRAIPLQGVYAVRVSTAGLPLWPGVANVGRRPTVSGMRERLEVHLLDFAGDLYGRMLKVDFIQPIRPEQKFESLAALRTQIAQDVLTARRLLT